MRFKARFTREQGQLLHQIMSSLEKIAKGAVIHISRKALRIMVVTDALTVDAPFGLAEFECDEIFEDLRIESANDNAILLKIEQLGLLTWAMASVKQATGLSQLKLVKRGDRPCLCFETKPGDMNDGAAVKVQHDIPIRVLHVLELKEYMPPATPPPDVCLELPRSRIFRSVVEKSNKFGRKMIVHGKQAGSLALHVEDGMIAVQTYLSPLEPVALVGPNEHDDDDNNHHHFEMDELDDDAREARVKVDIRKLSQVLNLQSVPWEHALVYLVHNAALSLQVNMDSGAVVRFHIPVISLDDME
jgi:hypothetical protein